MTIIHNLGFPRIGAKRELKFACEDYWKGNSSLDKLEATARELRHQHWVWQLEQDLDLLPVGDFSYYDQVLDTSLLLGNIPARFATESPDLDTYFQVARGGTASSGNGHCCNLAAGEMTKWFDTNYHYIVPEFDETTTFSLNPAKILGEIKEARTLTDKVKPVILGPLSYLWLGKITAGNPINAQQQKLNYLEQLLPVYCELLKAIAEQDIEWVQIDEPILALDLPQDWLNAFEHCYYRLQVKPLSILLATYFGPLQQNLGTALRLPVEGVHLDMVRGKADLTKAIDLLSPHKVLSLGVIDGRNIWKTDLHERLEWLRPVAEKLAERLWLAPSCSLLHVPVDLDAEEKLDPEIKNWLAFARQKLTELRVLKNALAGDKDTALFLQQNHAACHARKTSSRVTDALVQTKLEKITPAHGRRKNVYEVRRKAQQRKFDLPLFPTTTIGSFPQTGEIRTARKSYKNGTINEAEYDAILQDEIRHAIHVQEELGLDVLVHGEAERNDMVEYFAEHLQGYAFSEFGWVQSYGSRCVKPPVIYGDVSRPTKITVAWSRFAQSLSNKPVKGMLTGPITMLQWAFVRDDQPREKTALQIALALRDEVHDLEQAGISVIQVDEPALREGLPLRRNEWNDYLRWAVEAFRISTCSVEDSTQIHTHMCYAEFNDIIQAIADLDADVITIETSRSNMELIDAFAGFNYPNEIGPGVYDIHSPVIPTKDQMINLIKKATAYLPKERIWINPDCGLKTRDWKEVKPALENLVAAAKFLRENA